MLDQPLRRNRRGVVLLAGVLATFTALAWIGQAPARAETAAPMLKLAITMTQRAGTRTRQVTLALAGPQGKAMRMAQAAEGGAGGTGGTGGTGGEGLPPIALDMTARLLDGNQVLVDMVLWEGEPLAATARPRMVIELGKPARIVRGGPGGQDSITLEIVPSLHP